MPDSGLCGIAFFKNLPCLYNISPSIVAKGRHINKQSKAVETPTIALLPQFFDMPFGQDCRKYKRCYKRHKIKTSVRRRSTISIWPTRHTMAGRIHNGIDALKTGVSLPLPRDRKRAISTRAMVISTTKKLTSTYVSSVMNTATKIRPGWIFSKSLLIGCLF